MDVHLWTAVVRWRAATEEGVVEATEAEAVVAAAGEGRGKTSRRRF